jgi:hypothetical protein
MNFSRIVALGILVLRPLAAPCAAEAPRQQPNIIFL